MCDFWRDIERVKQSEILSYLNRGLIYTLGTLRSVFRSRPYRSIVREMQNRASLPLITMGDYMCDFWRDIERVKQSEILSHHNRGLIYTLEMHGFVLRSRPYRSIFPEMQNRASLPLITMGGYVCALWRDIARVKQSEILSHLNRGLIYTLGMHGFVFRSRP